MKPSVLITGASSGIGRAAARELLAHGYRVLGTSRRPEAAAGALPEIEWLAMDVDDDTSVAEAFRALEARCPRLDALVCNAGMGIFGSVEEVPLEAARRQLETNFFGVLRVLRAALPAMRRQGAGRIAVVGSLAGRAPIPFQAHYSASKAAVDALVQALRNELAPTGVCVCLVEPGDIDTAFNEAMAWGDADASVYGARIRSAERVIRESLPRAPGPEVVARAIRRALDDPRPRLRYPVGPDSRGVPFARRFLPERLLQWMIRRHFRV